MAIGVSSGDFTPSRFDGASENCLRESEPGDRAGAGHVVKARPVLWLAKAAGQCSVTMVCVARASANDDVGAPIWSSTMESWSRSRARRSMVSRKLLPCGP